ncbi:MAG: glutamate racemase [Candidatus Omnitrophica bacterium]|nr:glutamate racemase [Candidatus Omnitrophota bacterium]
MSERNQPIGIFDSGVGGLTVVRELQKVLPQEKFIYFGDTARVPYGNKSPNTVIKFSLENIVFLLKQNVKLVVVACNTSSSLALPFIRQYFRIPIVGVVNPAVRESVYATRNMRIGVIGTRATISSGVYEQEIKRLAPTIKVFTQSCPLFVPLVEEGWWEGEVVLNIAQRYLLPLKEKTVDTLILACTHYPLLKKVIKEIMGEEVALIDSAREVAIEVRKILEEENLLYQGKRKEKEIIYFVTDKSEAFREIGEKFLGGKIKDIYEIKGG